MASIGGNGLGLRLGLRVRGHDVMLVPGFASDEIVGMCGGMPGGGKREY
jgi:hypothetical protein